MTDYDPPLGYHYEWREDTDWQVRGDDRRCRRRGCFARAVARLFRVGKLRSGWWYYCPNHLYGRIVENGVVKERILVRDIA